ncbi:MAG: hypothetical protein ABFE07_28510 [Armatimonadia bacterium]
MTHTMRALNASIKHWERVLSGKDTRATADECALCQKFYDDEAEDGCAACPLWAYCMECDCFQEETPVSPYDDFLCHNTATEVTKPEERSAEQQETIEVMLMALMVVREAVREEEGS